MSIAALTIRLPGAMLLLAAPMLMALLTWRRVANIAVLLRLAAMTALILAIAQPEWRAGAASGPLIVVADRSDSISAADRKVEIDWIQQAAARASAQSPVSLVVFAGGAAVTKISRPLTRAEIERLLASRVDGAQTNLAAALRIAGGMAAPGSRIVLLTDGLQTTDDAFAPTGTGMAKIPVFTVLLNRPARPDVALTRVLAPKTAPAGVPLPVSVTITSTVAQTVTLTLRVDGRAIGSQALAAPAGASPYQIDVPGQPRGWHAVQAMVSAARDAVPQNNTLIAATDVSRPARVLLVAPPSSVAAAARVLGGTPVTLTPVAPNAMPPVAARIAQYDSVILDDIPATALTGKQVSALDDAVRRLGVGLFVLGGTHSLTEGHYSQSALERLLPVTSVTPASFQDGNIALQLVLDRSGSMDNLAGDVPKIVMSRAAARLAADFTLQHKDALGILSFDQVSHVLVPMGPFGATPKARIYQTIAGMYSDGGTNIFQALQLGIAQVSHSTAPYRHIILMTDGRSDPANYLPALRQAQRLKITISTVALGPDADTQLLHYMAALGKGRFYYTTNARDLPQIFAEEARLSAGSAAVTGTIGIRIASNSPTVRSLGASALPTLGGYTATVLKPGAVDDLETITRERKPDPLLARWQYGLGRVLVWTPGVSNAWSAPWRARETRFWSDALDWTLRGALQSSLSPSLAGAPAPDKLAIDTFSSGGAAVDLHRLEAVVRAPGGDASRHDAVQTAPGMYEVPYQFATPGVYAVDITDTTANSGAVHALVAVPYSREYLPAAPDQAFLKELSAASGGQALTDPARIGGLAGGNAPSALWWALVAIALAVFVAAIACDRLAPRPG